MQTAKLIGAVAAALGVLGVLGAVAVAQQAGGSADPVLHEYIAPPDVTNTPGRREGAPIVLGGEPSAGQNPLGIKTDDKLYQAPKLSSDKLPEEPVFGTNEFGADRDTSTRPDYGTGPDGTLKYVEVFNPSVVPFKRMSSLDAIEGDYRLIIYDHERKELPVGGQTSPDRDPFWGSITIELAGEKPIAIPSVAANMRFLSYETDPKTELVFTKDGADNYYVEAADARTTGRVRLVFLVDAPVTYFAPQIAHGMSVAEAAEQSTAYVHRLPPQAARTAAEVMARIGVQPAMPLDEAIDRLVAYHRAFEAGESPPHTNDIYRDLAFSQRGVCRHRSFTFVVTAWALGIGARFVTNEAHAFVEVFIPEQGWARIDLGGSALNMDVKGGKDKDIYQPRSEDPFPKPPQYADNYTQMRGEVSGLSEKQKRQIRGEDRDGKGKGKSKDKDGKGKDGTNGTDLDGDDPDGKVSRSTAPLTPAPGEGLPQPPPSSYRNKQPSTITVDGVASAAVRGDRVRVNGRLLAADGKPLGRQPVTIFWKPVDARHGDARRMAEATTADDGSYEVLVDVPADLELGAHEVYGSFGGDARNQPALSQ